MWRCWSSTAARPMNAAIATDLAHKDSRVRVLSNPAVTIPASLNV